MTQESAERGDEFTPTKPERLGIAERVYTIVIVVFLLSLLLFLSWLYGKTECLDAPGGNRKLGNFFGRRFRGWQSGKSSDGRRMLPLFLAQISRGKSVAPNSAVTKNTRTCMFVPS